MILRDKLKFWMALSNYVDMIVRGTSPLSLPDAIANSLSYVKAFGGTEQNGIPTPTAPVDIVTNNGVLKARHQSGLPLGYTLLDYIESNGTQYIDTGILLSNTDVFEIAFQSLNMLETPVMGAISGGTSYTSTGNLSVTYTMIIGLSAYSVYCDGAAGNSNYSWNGGNRADGLKHTIKYNGLNIAPTLDGVSMTQVGTHTLTENTPTVTTWLFGRNNTSTGTLSQSGVRIYDFHIQGKGHFIPAKRNSDNVLGMYDTVSGQFFTNQGTGDFVAGNTVSDPVEIYTDGAVETINAHGTNLLDLANCVDGYYYNPNGVYSEASAVRLSNFVKVKANETYTVFVYGLKGSVNVRVNLFDTNKNWLSQQATPSTLNQYTAITITATQDGYLAFSANFVTTGSCIDWGVSQVVRGAYTVATMPEYQPYYDGGTATAEMLLKVGNYQDEQEILSGAITRKVGVKVLDGTETWELGAGTSESSFYVYSDNVISGRKNGATGSLVSHFEVLTSSILGTTGKCFLGVSTQRVNFTIAPALANSVSAFKQWLAAQYTAGTPVIVVYPLAEPTTESVAGQTLQVTDGDNVLEITQASLTGLELEAKYKKEA